MHNLIIQIAGWVGSVLIVLAYFLNSFKKIDSSGKTYQFMNLFGAAGVGVNAFYHNALPAFGMEVIWMLIAFFALINIVIKKRQMINK
jgi:hypothetical protein